MQIHGTSHVHGPHGINAPHSVNRTSSAPATKTGGVDRVEISQAADAASRAAETGPIRQSLVNNIRAQIAAGTYETTAKLDAAVDRLLDEIG